MIYFVDTNVLVDALEDESEPRRRIAQEFLSDASMRVVLSPQVLGEFFITIRRRFADQFSASDAAELAELLRPRCTVLIDGELSLRAMWTAGEHQLGYAHIIETAREADCAHLATEELQHGVVIRGVEIWNPLADLV